MNSRSVRDSTVNRPTTRPCETSGATSAERAPQRVRLPRNSVLSRRSFSMSSIDSVWRCNTSPATTSCGIVQTLADGAHIRMLGLDQTDPAVVVEQHQPGVIGREDFDQLSRRLTQDQVKVERGAERVGHPIEEGHALVALAELDRAGLDFDQQPRVLQRDSGLIGQGLGQFDLAGCIATAGARFFDLQHPDRHTRGDQRQDQGRVGAAAAQRLAVGLEQARGLDVLDHDRRQGLAGAREGCDERGGRETAGGLVRGQHSRAALGVEREQRQLRRVERGRDLAHQRVVERVQVERAAELARDAVEQSQPLRARVDLDAALLVLLEQAGVVERRRGLIGESRHQADEIVGVEVGLDLVERQRADDAALADQRRAQP